MNATWSELSTQPKSGHKQGVEDSAGYWSNFWIQHGNASKDQVADLRVLRTFQGKPLSSELTTSIVAHTLQLLQLQPDAVVVDLACGTGLFTIPIATQCRSVIAVDVSADFIASLSIHNANNVATVVCDLRDFEFPERAFDRILLYAAIQYFEHAEVVELFKRIALSLRPNGMLFVGDVPDATRRWQFFNTPQRRMDYFLNLSKGTPIIGTWFEPDWLAYAGEAAGFARSIRHPQPETFPYAHFRFDMQFTRA